ncbi:MAG TPA: hypothetical protein VK844_05800, partial [Hyphomicrobiales bacterium]|nr:hypothetical protein [Hyphomicrobiales bacterium]
PAIAEAGASNSGGPAPQGGPAPAPRRSNDGKAGKWNLPDLLARASQGEGGAPRKAAPQAQPAPPPPPADQGKPVNGEAGRTPLHAVESLNSLSVDLARAIDHEAPAELWERYRRGERGVFTRRLYTLRGQRNFDEIRNKYRSDAEFRDTVDRYVSEFEQLIENVSRNDRDNILTQTYLSSDTGKVYIMLAHASGRFD